MTKRFLKVFSAPKLHLEERGAKERLEALKEMTLNDVFKVRMSHFVTCVALTPSLCLFLASFPLCLRWERLRQKERR